MNMFLFLKIKDCQLYNKSQKLLPVFFIYQIRFIPILFWLFIITGCNKKNNKNLIKLSNTKFILYQIPNINVDKSQIKYDNFSSIYSINNKPFCGYMVSYFKDTIIKEKIGILNGKKHNQATFWYPDGKLKLISNFNKGKLHGEKKIWSNEHDYILIAKLNYKNGKAHGEQKQWYKTGELYKKLNLSNGKEDGIQQAYRKNGELYANYEAKNNRIFGLKKTALCYDLENENIK